MFNTFIILIIIIFLNFYAIKMLLSFHLKTKDNKYTYIHFFPIARKNLTHYYYFVFFFSCPPLPLTIEKRTIFFIL